MAHDHLDDVAVVLALLLLYSLRDAWDHSPCVNNLKSSVHSSVLGVAGQCDAMIGRDPGNGQRCNEPS